MYRKRSTLIIILLLIVIAGLLGWILGTSGGDNAVQNATSTSNTTPANNTSNNNQVKSMVSYPLPDGWKEGECSGISGIVYIVPSGTTLNCNANPSAPIKMYVDPQNTTDCEQLNKVQDVKKHVCISLFIDGHKNLKASTVYPQSSSHSAETTISDYFVNSGKGVVKVEYTYTSNNDYQTGFDQLATSIKVK